MRRLAIILTVLLGFRAVTAAEPAHSDRVALVQPMPDPAPAFREVRLPLEPPPAPDMDPGTFAAWLLDRIRSGQWTAVTGGCLMLLSFLLRLSLGKLHSWFRTRAGGVVTALLTAFTSIVGLAFAAGAEPSLGLVLTALGAAAAASGLWTWVTDMFPSFKTAAKGAKLELPPMRADR